MFEMLLFAAMLAAAYSGFLLLALSQRQNWNRMLPDRTLAISPPARQLRIVGGASLGLSLTAALFRDGAAFGPILWVVSLAIAGAAVVATLAVRAAWLRSAILAVSHWR